MTPRPKSKTPTKEAVATVRLDAGLRADMEKLRERDGVPFAEQIRRALEMFLESKGVRLKARGKSAGAVGTTRVDRLL